MKTYNNYGVLMNSLETMKFDLFKQTLKFGLNTITKDERFKIATTWILNYRQ